VSKLLIDCDPGQDDAIAILYAARHCDLLGITTCHGNNTIENVTRNALSVLALGEIDVPVARGCAGPLLGARAHGGEMHGPSGLDGAELPPPTCKPVPEHAVDFIIDHASTHRGELVLAVIGPATNVALAIRREPRLPSWLREITVMGGSAGIGNMRPTVEFNVWSDPEAAAILFACGAPIRMVGYDVTSRTGMDAAALARLAAGGRVAQVAASLLGFYRERNQAWFGREIAPLHDVCAIVPYVDDSLIRYRHCHVAVELTGTLTRGMTVCDLRSLTAEGRERRVAGVPNAQVAVAADTVRLIDGVIETLLAYS
jgi:inosine-uridine nucleoside N-ribohydrolase